MDEKIFFTDLDGTLLDKDKQISDDNKLAINAALDEGHKVVIATGRPLISVSRLIEDLELNHEGCFAITYNGGLIYDCHEKKAIYKEAVPMDCVKHIFETAKEFGFSCQTYDDKMLIAPVDTPEIQRYVNISQIDYKIDPECPNNLKNAPVKVLVAADEERIRSEAYIKEIRSWAKGNIDVFYSSRTYIEHVAAGVSKGKAMKLLCEHCNIPLSNTVAAGDAENDITMIETASVGIAMQNAADHIKKSADYVTENDFNNSGVAEAINKFIL